MMVSFWGSLVGAQCTHSHFKSYYFGDIWSSHLVILQKKGEKKKISFV